MATWRCLHRRVPEFTFLGLATDDELRAMIRRRDDWCFSAEGELLDRQEDCPACTTQNRRLRRAWAALAVVAIVILLVGWRVC